MSPPTVSSIQRVTTASMFGTVLEVYDFTIYGTASALIFGKQFFPDMSPAAGLVASFATFGVGFAARPLGAIVFGHLGDRFGRKPMLMATLLIMGLASAAIGILPGYKSIGIAAPILLVALRLVQGIGLGGELGGAQVLTTEHAPTRRRGLVASIIQMASVLGALLANGVLLWFTHGMSSSAFSNWGWRIPFLLSVIVVAVGLYLRRRVTESPVFQAMKKTTVPVKVPAWQLIHDHPVKLLLAVMVFISSVAFYVNSVYSLSYAHGLGVSTATMLGLLVIMNAVTIPAAPIGGVLSDRFGRRPVMAISASVLVLALVVYFPAFQTKSVGLILTMMIIVGFVAQIFGGAQSVFIAEQFGPEIRYSAVSISYALGTVLGGGLAPFIAAALLAASGGDPWPVTCYAVGAELIALAGVLILKERRGVNLAARDAALPEAAEVPARVQAAGSTAPEAV
jgi:MFS transporter, MHS family, shikimate and dehydroshikimate transport protein